MKSTWTRVATKDLPAAPEDAATIVISVPFHGYEVTRAITVVQTGQNHQQGQDHGHVEMGSRLFCQSSVHQQLLGEREGTEEALCRRPAHLQQHPESYRIVS